MSQSETGPADGTCGGAEGRPLPLPGNAAGTINLRRWFDVYLAWMIGLGIVLAVGRMEAEAGSRAGFVAMCFAAYALYLSLCNTFFPAPTAWAIMLMASNGLAMFESPIARVAVAASVGALATSMANLNEYHVFTFLLETRRGGRIRTTRVYRWAADVFAVSPFALICMVAVVPIPVDVVRWLAIAYRYSRLRFFAAYLLGRTFRYGLLGAGAVVFNLSDLQIVLIQAGLVALAGAKVLVGWMRHRRARRVQAGAVESPAATA